MDGEPTLLGFDGETGAGLLSVAFNDECDVVVALAAYGDGDPATIEPAVTSCQDPPMVLWAKKELAWVCVAIGEAPKSNDDGQTRVRRCSAVFELG
jgi:hypothetical protein